METRLTRSGDNHVSFEANKNTSYNSVYSFRIPSLGTFDKERTKLARKKACWLDSEGYIALSCVAELEQSFQYRVGAIGTGDVEMNQP